MLFYVYGIVVCHLTVGYRLADYLEKVPNDRSERRLTSGKTEDSRKDYTTFEHES